MDLRDSGRCWILNGNIHHANSGVRIRLPGGIENVVQSNRIYDNSVVDWPWDSVKSHDAEGNGVGISGGRGNIVRLNEIDGFFNGVGATGWPDFDLKSPPRPRLHAMSSATSVTTASSRMAPP